MITNFWFVLRTDPMPLLLAMATALLCYYLAKWGWRTR